MVLEHLQHQLQSLQDVDQAAVQAIQSIVEEEQLHHDQSAQQHENARSA